MAGYDAAGKFVSHCDLAANLTKFPFDSVTCSLQFQSWKPTILVKIKNRGFQVDYSKPDSKPDPDFFMRGSSVWKLMGVSTSESVITMGSHNYNRFSFDFYFKRQPTIYLVSVFAPTFALFLLLLASFAIPIEQAERPAFSLTIVLSFFLLQAIVDSKLPESREPTMISIYLTCLLWLGTITTCYFSIAYSLNQSERWKNAALTVPLFNRKFNLILMLDFLAFSITLFCSIACNVTFFLSTTSV